MFNLIRNNFEKKKKNFQLLNLLFNHESMCYIP